MKHAIKENSVAKYAVENLTEEQAQVVNQSLSGYISNLLDKEENWINLIFIDKVPVLRRHQIIIL